MQSEAESDSQRGHSVLWLSPLAVEMAPLLGLLGSDASVRLAGHKVRRGVLAGTEVVAAVCGAGAACAHVLSDLLSVLSKAGVVLVGTAGALNPALVVGDVVVAHDAASQPDPAAAPAATSSVRAQPGSEFPFKVLAGTILTWHAPVLDVELKQRLRAAYGADCVDMETSPAAQVCAAQGVPFMAVRSISDLADGRDLTPRDVAIAAWHATVVAVREINSF